MRLNRETIGLILISAAFIVTWAIALSGTINSEEVCVMDADGLVQCGQPVAVRSVR